jgi:acyl carrier protein
MTATELRLQTIVAEKLQITPAHVPLDQSMTDELGLDSFDLMNIVLEIERAFPPLSLSDEAAQELRPCAKWPPTLIVKLRLRLLMT